MSTLRVNTIQNQAGTGQPSISGLAQAWVNFNGTGTVAIRAAFNVSSITDNGTGIYTVNFANALPDANYSFVFNGGGTSTGSYTRLDNPATVTTTSFGSIMCRDTSNASIDWLYMSVAVFR